MLKTVSKLKKFGIFRDFLWTNSTSDFAHFNLIYGWNKSGKTTFSRVFVACEKKSTDFKKYPKDGEFEIKMDCETVLNHLNCQKGIKQIKVFNKDFVEDNVSFDPTNSSKPIVYISEEDIENNKKLEELRKKVIPLAQKYDLARKERQRSERAEDNFRKSTARTIKDIVGNLKTNDKYRDYDKGSIKSTIEKIGIDNFSKLSEESFEMKKKFISSDSPKDRSLFSKYEFSFSFNGKNIKNFSEIFNEASKLLEWEVIAKTIDRFKDDPELNKWAQIGFELHKNKGEKRKCLFCQNEFSAGFIDSLSKHFSDDYEKLQSDINSFITSLEDLRKDKVLEKDQELYADLQGKYENEAVKLNKVVSELDDWMDKTLKKLRKKDENPLLEIGGLELPKDFVSIYNEVVKDLNVIIGDHNEKVNNHQQEVNKAKEDLEKHFIAVEIEEQDYLKIKSDYIESIEAEKEAKRMCDENEQEISRLEKETSNIGRALPRINKHLEEFFGRKEILLELDDFKKGYIIKREGDVANNLSEGEKNAIAFSYFIVKTQEKGFKINEEIIIIDDPVSSFDLNFIYHCFSLIKNCFENAEQLFILTHNFEFFNLVKDWFCIKNRKVESKNKGAMNDLDKKPIPCEFYMIENVIENGKRCASIVPLEKTLKNFKSEYHFLFSKLNQFITNGMPDYADFYTIGNIARRFLEIYINFKIPTTGDLKSRIDQLNTKNVSKIEKDKVYRLIQEFSHGLDPASAIEHKDKSEIQNAIRILMKIVEESDKKHFETLKSCM